jgi:hypothetical protein
MVNCGRWAWLEEVGHCGVFLELYLALALVLLPLLYFLSTMM